MGDTGRERGRLYRLTEGQHCSEVQCTLLCQSGMHDPRAQWRQCGRKIARTREERIRVVSFGAETATFPRLLSFSLSPAHFFPILFFPIHELQLTVERFWNARAFYGAAAPFITAGCSRIHTPIIKAEQDLAGRRVEPYLFWTLFQQGSFALGFNFLAKITELNMVPNEKSACAKINRQM